MVIKGDNLAGNIINSGSFGCTFHPSLECENFKTSDKFISKLMTYKDAIEEYQISIMLKQIFDNILPNYKKYIILSESICNISHIPNDELVGFERCYLFESLNIKREEVNDNLKDLIILNQRYGGVELSKFKGNFAKLLLSFLDIIKNCLIVLNKHSIYHGDLKASNVLVSKSNLYLIDWGNSSIRPTMENFIHYNKITYNVPFGAVIFGEHFKSCIFSNVDCVVLFVKNHPHTGHIKFTQEIISFFGLNPNSIQDYLIKIITTYTKEEYFKIFLHNLDLWGIVSCLADLFINPKNRNNAIFKKYGYELFHYIYTNVDYLDVHKIIKLLELFYKSISHKSLKASKNKFKPLTKRKSKSLK